MTCTTCNGRRYVALANMLFGPCPDCCPPVREVPEQEGARRSEGNVKVLPVISPFDIPIERVLESAIDASQRLRVCIVVGEDEKGGLYFASSKANGPDVLWALERARRELMKGGGA